MTREEITEQLLDGCPDESLFDHEVIAIAIRNGDDIVDLLEMPQCDAWPMTASWLQDHTKYLTHRQRTRPQIMSAIATTTYTADFRQVSITFFSDADPEFVVVGKVSDAEIMALHAAEGGNVSGWNCHIS